MKAKRSRSVVRKEPQQARAQATVGAILQAMVQILDREGLEAATMAHIAEVAGVSEFARSLTLVQELLGDQNLAQSPEQVVTAVVRGLAELYRSCPGLHRVLTMEGLRVTKADRVQAFDRRVIEIVRHFLLATSAPLRPRDVEAAAFVVVQAVRATMLACLLERPPGLDEEKLIQEVVDLVLCYLVRRDPIETRVVTALPAVAKTGGRS